MSVHHAAAKGFAAAATTYGRGRPDYPPQVDLWLAERLGVGPGVRVLDLGAGTGKFTDRLLAMGAETVAVEPVAEMAAALAGRLPAAQVLAGSAEAIPCADASFDVVVCAQAFHWFATPEALAEIRRVLKPRGALGLVWNVRDETVDWVRALTAIFAPYEGDAPRFHSGAWRRVFPAPDFTPLALERWPWAHVGPAEDVVLARALSISFIAALPAEERAKVEARVRRLIETTPALAGGGDVAFPYVTEAYACRAEGFA